MATLPPSLAPNALLNVCRSPVQFAISNSHANAEYPEIALPHNFSEGVKRSRRILHEF
jgi:hypothetical protein